MHFRGNISDLYIKISRAEKKLYRSCTPHVPAVALQVLDATKLQFRLGATYFRDAPGPPSDVGSNGEEAKGGVKV